MNRIFVYIGIIAGLLLGGSLSVEAQKKPLDIEACTSWKRIDAPDISPTGRWVTYRISLMEYNPASKEEKKLHLFDSRTRKEILLNGDIERLEFYNNDQGAFYRLADSAGVMKTFLLSLPSGVKTEWKHKEAFRPVEGTPYSISVTNVPKDTVNHVPAFNRLVVRHLKTEVAFHIDSIGYHTLYDGGRSILFIRKKSDRNELCYGPLAGPYKTLYQSSVKSEPSSYSFNEKEMIGEFSVNDSLWYAFSLRKPGCNLLFDRKEIVLPDGMSVGRIDLSKSHNFLILELRDSQQISRRREESEKKPDKSFELELWTWNEMEVPTLQRGGRYRQDKSVTYIYDIFSKKLTEVAPFTVDLLLPSGAENLNYVLYTDESPYKMQREWLDRLPFDIYSVNVHTGAKRLIGRSYRTAPKWSVNGKWAVMYDPIAQVWNKFDGATGKVVNISDAIGYPMFMESYDKPAPAPAYGIAGWTADGNNVFLYDAYDWWKIDLTGERQPECLTKGYGRKHGKSIRKMTSNIDKDVFQKDEKVIVSLWDKDTMDEGVYQLDMKGRLRKLMEGNYVYTIHRFSDNHEYCVWNRQNVSEFRDLWWSKSDFSNPVKVTNANPQQADYKWGTVKLIKWTNYENKENKGLLYLPEDYDPQKEYPVLVQFYETHSGELNIYHAPLLSSALGNPMYFASNGYIVFMPDVHFTVGTPGQSCYDAVVSGTKYLIEQGVDESRVIQEEQAHDTRENLEYSRVLAEQHGMDTASVLIITSDFHLCRAKYLARKLGMEPYGLASQTWPEILRVNYLLREVFAFIKAAM